MTPERQARILLTYITKLKETPAGEAICEAQPKFVIEAMIEEAQRILALWPKP
jgi:hypothetical protein